MSFASQPSERRKFKRYPLTRPLSGVVEHEHRCYAGNVVDISFGGFRLFVPNVDAGSFRVPGGMDFGEVISEGRNVGGFGNIAFATNALQGAAIGFNWDEYVLAEHHDALGRLIDFIAGQRNAGRVAIDGNRLILRGHVTSALAIDVYPMVGRGISSIFMEECLSIDPGGVDMLIGLKAAGVHVVACNTEIAPILDRFRLLSSAQSDAG